jgi:hypothetical protein
MQSISIDTYSEYQIKAYQYILAANIKAKLINRHLEQRLKQSISIDTCSKYQCKGYQ